MAWGISGSSSRSQMEGADVAVARYSADLRQAFVQDYNISAKAPVSTLLSERANPTNIDCMYVGARVHFSANLDETRIQVLKFHNFFIVDDFYWTCIFPKTSLDN